MQATSPASQLQISIAIVTRNRPESLERTLASWRRQTHQPSEILVSDDSDDSVRSEVKSIALRYDAVWIAGPRRGLYANRNHVVSFCNGSHFLSGDDDHEHPLDLLKKCHSAVESDARAIWCLGEVHDWSDLEKGWLIPGELHLSGAPGPPHDANNTWAWSDGATLCPREVFASGLRFAEDFRFGASYLEFGCLLYYLGYRIRILNETGVVHHISEHRRSFEEPVEDRAALLFALLMLGLVYQKTPKNLLRLGLYFVRQSVRRPSMLLRSFPKAWRAKCARQSWLKNWYNDDGGRLVSLESVSSG